VEIGTSIRIVNYGNLIWSSEPFAYNYPLLTEKDGIKVYDTSPELIGMTGVITDKSKSENERNTRYAIYFSDGNKRAWFNESQLEIIPTKGA
jgi:hypothetical protein